jgi:hypothetical protein
VKKGRYALYVAATALVAAPVLLSVAQATSLTLGCTGTVTRTYVFKDGIAREPRKEPVSDYSVVVDLDRQVILGFWYESTGHLIASVPAALPIKEANASGISFAAERKIGRTEGRITGGVDRVTGTVNADEFTTFSGGATQHQAWDLHCRSR